MLHNKLKQDSLRNMYQGSMAGWINGLESHLTLQRSNSFSISVMSIFTELQFPKVSVLALFVHSHETFRPCAEILEIYNKYPGICDT